METPAHGDVRFSLSPSRMGRTVLLSMLVGVSAGLSARLLESTLQFAVPLVIGAVARPGEATTIQLHWYLIVLPVLGGLASGLLVAATCRPDRAHGTGILIDAFHHRGGNLALKDAAVRAAAAVVVIACGGSVGKEAAIAVLGAAIGSRYAKALDLSPRERRIFLVAGCAAGVGAIFQCPLGGALFAVTVLYREPDIEADGVMPALIASVMGYSVFMAFGQFGQFLLQGTRRLVFVTPMELPAYAVLGVTCALGAMVFRYSLLGVAACPGRRYLPRWLAPAIGGLVVGLIACAYPQVMDSSYRLVQNALGDAWFGKAPAWREWVLFFSAVAVSKAVATAAMMGTETAGGLFGPVVFMGGVVGAGTGAFFEAYLPGAFPETLREAMIPVGMAGLLSASLRVPLAAVVMVMEMTGSYGLIVPLMLTSVIAYVFGRRWGVYGEQVAGLEHSPAHAGESIVGVLETWRVADLMVQSWPHVAKEETTLPELVAMIPSGTRPCFAIIDDGRFCGLLSTEDVVHAARQMGPSRLIVAHDIMDPGAPITHPDDDIYGTLGWFAREHLEALPVVAHEERKLVGMLTRSAIHRALRNHINQQHAMLLKEHAGLATIAQDGLLEALLSVLPVEPRDGVRRIPVPAEAVGKSLRTSEFRRTQGCEVIAIEPPGGTLIAPADPDRPLSADDHLIVLPRCEGPVVQRRVPAAERN